MTHAYTSNITPNHTYSWQTLIKRNDTLLVAVNSQNLEGKAKYKNDPSETL